MSFFVTFVSFVRFVVGVGVATAPVGAGLVGVVALIVSVSCSPGAPPGDDEYVARLLQARAEKDRLFREDDESPIPAGQRATFPPLAYFPPDPAYRVPASLTPAADGEAIEMATSDGQRRKMRRIGTLRFTLKGQPLQLTAFTESANPDPSRLFVPFGDLTSGSETYPGGRYLDLDRTATGIYELDFNRGYHPFCLYNPSFICPVPPSENRLPLPVRAGERLQAEAGGRPSASSGRPERVEGRGSEARSPDR